VSSVAALLEGAAGWWLSGGEALDVFMGRQTRAHGDIDVSITPVRWPAVRSRLRGVLRPWAWVGGEAREIVDELPEGASPNLWLEEVAAGTWALQINVESGDAAEWIYRREPRIRLPWARAVLTIRALPIVHPAVQLLWKSKTPQLKDDADLALVLPLLAAADRRWLVESVGLAHPASRWLPGLSGAAPDEPASLAGRPTDGTA
jgi:hypothetical protein